MFAKPLGGFGGQGALVHPFDELAVKCFSIFFVLREVSFFQAVAVDGVDDTPEQLAEGDDESFELLIKGVFEQFVVQVAEQVDQAFLSPEPQRFVAREKVRHDDPGEVL